MKVATRPEAVRAFLEWAGEGIERGYHRHAKNSEGEWVEDAVAEGYAILQAESDSLEAPANLARYVILVRELDLDQYHTFETARTLKDAERIAQDFEAEPSNKAEILSVVDCLARFLPMVGGES